MTDLLPVMDPAEARRLLPDVLQRQRVRLAPHRPVLVAFLHRRDDGTGLARHVARLDGLGADARAPAPHLTPHSRASRPPVRGARGNNHTGSIERTGKS